MGRFVRHISCTKCGSKDNAAQYDDGGVYCFSCREALKLSDEFANNNEPSTGYRLPHLTPAPLEPRMIHETNTKLYRVGVDEDYTAVYFPYYLDGKVVGAKKRMIDNWEDKDYRWEGNGKVGLFGMQTATDRHKKLMILEGELDALAANQMYGMTYTCVSVAHGAAGAANDLKRHLEFVNGFDEVVLCLDMDEPGRAAVDECIKLIKPGKCKVALLPEGFKDANDMLKAKDDTGFRRAIEQAQKVLPHDYTDDEQEMVVKVDKRLYTYEEGCKFPTPYASLNKAIGGLNPGELITLVADTGVGKTTLGLSLVLNAIEQGRKVFLITLETVPEDVIIKLVEMRTGYPLYSSPDGVKNTPREAYDADLRFICKHLAIYTGMGSMPMEKLENLIEYGAMASKVDCVFLDHITAATQTTSANLTASIDTTTAMLNKLTTYHNLSTIVISHISRGEHNAKLSLDRIRNSSGIAQYSHAVIGMQRDIQDSNAVVEVSMLKGHRRFGVVPPFFMKYNKSTFRYEEVNGSTTQEGSGSPGKSFTEALKIRQQEKEKQRRVNQLPEPVRVEDTREQSEPDVRTDDTEVREDVQTRFPIDWKKWEEDFYRSKGLPSPRRPFKTISGKEVEPPPSLEAIVYLRNERDKRRREQGKPPGILGMG